MVRIRPATVEDSDRIAVVHVETWQAAYAGVMPADFLAALDPAERAYRWRRILADRTPPTEVFVAELDGELVGFAAVTPFRSEEEPLDPSLGEVAAIYVAPQRWSAGAGAALMRSAIDHLDRQGLREIRLWVIAENPRARRFYERFGFVPDGHARRETVGEAHEAVPPIEEVRYTLALD